MIFVVTTSPGYDKAWVFPTLERLKSCRVTALLFPGDVRELPPNVERYDYTADCCNYDGRFLDALPPLPDDETVVFADVDAHVQRDFLPSELDPGDDVALGWNKSPTQKADEEFRLLQTSGCVSVYGVNKALETDISSVPVYNFGLVSAKVKTWKRLREAYRPILRDGYAFVPRSSHYMQFFLCVALHKAGIPVRSLGYETHSHGHFGPSPDQEIKDGRLYYRGELVMFAHLLPGVTH